ncbi:hypothetical protein ABXJ76_07815 [Methylobacter sp. G7]|uniref:hypothetical protein n=1 Tax=Methylobacter sp. G7 TaxID=3230117 RepID=UPI003D804B78
MRRQQSVRLDELRTVTVRELRVRDARKLLSQAKSLDQVDMQTLMVERFDELVVLLGDGIAMPDGETLEDLTFSEVALVKAALLEVNAAFLDLMGMVPEKAPNPQPTL